MTDPVLIIGAGVAGLSAATSLRLAGIECIVLEAANRVGGRAHTTMLGAFPFDHGASWLHAAERNPLADIARTAGDRLIDADAVRTRRVLVDGHTASGAEIAARLRAWEAVEEIATAQPADVAFANAIAPLRADPWTASIEAWEACQIAAADPRDFSVWDWRDNALEGSNLNVAGGLGAFVQRRLAPGAGTIRLGTAVTSVDWSDAITAETGAGRIRAAAVIVTVSTAALRGIRFTPALPVPPDNLPMGLLTKIALRATGRSRLGLAADESVSARTARDATMMSVIAWPGGADHIVAFIGGPPAWSLAHDGEAATVDFVRGRLRNWFGADADNAVGEAIVSNWADDPLHGGAYAYARPGHAGDRARLGMPFADGRIVIASEATATDGLAGTVGGAWNEGQRAAAAVRRALTTSRVWLSRSLQTRMPASPRN